MLRLLKQQPKQDYHEANAVDRNDPLELSAAELELEKRRVVFDEGDAL